MYRYFYSVAGAFCILSFLPSSGFGQRFEKLSPFTEVVYKDAQALVRFDGQMFELASIDDVPARKMLEYCQRQYDGIWEKRFAEDLVEVMATMGHRPGKTVVLVLRDTKTLAERTIVKAAMTHKNRQAVLRARLRTEEDDHSQPLVMTQAHMTQALDDFQQALQTRWSYYRANDADFDGAIDELQKKIDAEISPNDFVFLWGQTLFTVFNDPKNCKQGLTPKIV